LDASGKLFLTDGVGFAALSVFLHAALAMALIGSLGSSGRMGVGPELTMVSLETAAPTPPAPEHAQAPTEPEPVEASKPEDVAEDAVPLETVADSLPEDVRDESSPAEEPEDKDLAPEADPPLEEQGGPGDGGKFGIFCAHRDYLPQAVVYADEEETLNPSYPPGLEDWSKAMGGFALFGRAGGPTVKRLARPEGYGLGDNIEVLLVLRLDSYGRVAGISVLGSAGYEYDMAAVDVVRRSLFGPAVVGGRPVDCLALLPVRFGDMAVQ